MESSRPHASRPAEALLALVMPLAGLGAAHAQMQHVPRPPTPSAPLVVDHDLPCNAVRLTQIDGDAETYSYVMRNGGYNNRPTPATVTLKAGESRIIESGQATPFTLFPETVLSWAAKPVTPHPTPLHQPEHLVHTYVEAGPNITVYNLIGNEPPSQSSVVAGPQFNQRELTLLVNTNCAPATLVRSGGVGVDPDAGAHTLPPADDESAFQRLLKVLPDIEAGAETAAKAGPAIDFGPLIIATGIALDALTTPTSGTDTLDYKAVEDGMKLKCPQGLPTITFSYATMPAITTHIALAQGQHPEWKVLTISRDNGVANKRRGQACNNAARALTKPDTCDEYPFASTAEGGKGASTFPASSSEQNLQSILIKRFYSSPTIKPDMTKFCVAVSP